MKKHDENIEREIAKTMMLLDEMPPLELHHQFRVRLMQRVEREFGEGKKSHFGSRVDLRLAFMGLLLVVNLGSTVLTIFDGGRQATTTISELLDNQSFDYTSQDLAYYDQAATIPAVTETNQTP
jgi:hypothetical protein